MSTSVEKVPLEVPGSKARFGLPSWTTVLLSQMMPPLPAPLRALPSEESHSPGVWLKVGGGFESARIEIPAAVQSSFPVVQVLDTAAAPSLVVPLLAVAPALRVS